MDGSSLKTDMVRKERFALNYNSGYEKPRLAVLGLGHVGLPTALGFAELGWDVIGADDDASKVETIRSGNAPFYEPGMEELLARGLASGRLTLSHCVDEAVRDA